MPGDISNPFAPPEPMPAPTWAAPPAVSAGPGWPSPPPGFASVATPAAVLRIAASRARAAAVLSWVLIGGWAVVLIGGLVYVAAGAQEADGEVSKAVDTSDVAAAFVGLGLLIYLIGGVTMWALLALWASHTSRAARLAGNAERTRSGMAWWGHFVPVAGLVLPVLAYLEAAKYAYAAAAVRGQVTGRGEGWRNGPVPNLLLTWWLLYVPAAVGVAAYGSIAAEEYDANGAAALVAGIFGTSSAVCGAFALRHAAAAADLGSAESPDFRQVSGA